MMTQELTVEELQRQIAELKEIVDRLCTLVEGRNKSAPTKRNMTDDDARKCMTAPLDKLGHKECAEQIGLTYAQVYSCRLGFTFKHIHKEFRDAGVKNQWER